MSPPPDPGVESRVRLRAGDASVVLRTSAVREVARTPPLTPVPMAPAALAGLANLRGAVVPIVSLARLLGSELASRGERIVIVEGEEALGLAVDAVERESGDEDVTAVDDLLNRAFAARRRSAAVRREARAVPLSASEAVQATELGILVFEVSGQTYGLPLGEVAGVARPTAELLRSTPGDDGMVGEADHRGRRVDVRQAAHVLGLPARLAGPRSRIVVTSLGGAELGLLVDDLRGIVRTSQERLRSVPTALNLQSAVRIQAMVATAHGLVGVLSAEGFGDLTTAQGRAQDSEAQAAAGQGDAFLTFRLAGETYGVLAAAVIEVLKAPDGVAAPPRAGRVQGVMNWRGRPLAVVHPRERLGLSAHGPASPRILVMRDAEPWGMVVDAIEAIVRIEAKDLSQTPPLAEAAASVFHRTARVAADGRTILIVDEQELRRAATGGADEATSGKAPALA